MGKNITSIILFIIAFFGVQYGMKYYKEYSVKNSVSKEIESIREEARKNNSGESEIVAIQKVATKRAEENMNSKGTQEEKLKTAAGTFLGFYLVNIRQRSEYCLKQGIDITPFTDEFSESHKTEYAIAVKAISATLDDIDNLYEVLKDQSKKLIQQDMQFFANESKTSTADACKLISDHADILIPEMHFSISQPAVHGVLTSGT